MSGKRFRLTPQKDTYKKAHHENLAVHNRGIP